MKTLEQLKEDAAKKEFLATQPEEGNFHTMATEWIGFENGWDAAIKTLAPYIIRYREALEYIAAIELTDPFDCQKSPIDAVNAENAVSTANQALKNLSLIHI